jgi:hypothetical protein
MARSGDDQKLQAVLASVVPCQICFKTYIPMALVSPRSRERHNISRLIQGRYSVTRMTAGTRSMSRRPTQAEHVIENAVTRLEHDDIKSEPKLLQTSYVFPFTSWINAILDPGSLHLK